MAVTPDTEDAGSRGAAAPARDLSGTRRDRSAVRRSDPSGAARRAGERQDALMSRDLRCAEGVDDVAGRRRAGAPC